MGGNNRGLAATDLEAKLGDLAGVNALYDAFGDLAWPVLRRQYLSLGYQEGVARLTRLLEEGTFDKNEFAADPADGVRAWAEGYLQVVADLFPGVVIHYHNLESRRSGAGQDCVEAFQVVVP